ncbi:hypothetical protein HDZ31DRAFT_28618 [Schizophyllum fasciatum]
MASYGSFGVEPFEEASGGPGKATASPADLSAFYADMERKEKQDKLERQASKASRRKSGAAHGLFSRKSTKRASAVPAAPPPLPAPDGTLRAPDSAQDRSDLASLATHPSTTSLVAAASIIPDVLPELPDWFTTNHWVIYPGQVIKYTIHNPVGPRWYRNLHLKPPSVTRARPSSFFSPSFPPMATASVQERSEDSAALSRSPSNSPLPTPSSSQVRIAADANAKPRSRKTSLTAAHDTVDLLDASDPYGMNWHHQSPYDAGITAPSVVDVDTRSRVSSLNGVTRHRTVTPSPLSQSTSAVHLRPPSSGEQDGPRIPRKLSKRRAPLFGAFRKDNRDSKAATIDERGLISMPNSPTEAEIPDKASKSEVKLPISASLTTLPTSGGEYPKRMSMLQVPAVTSIKKERRGSVLGRIARRFSVVRKPQHEKQPSASSTHPPEHARDDSVSQDLQEWQHISADDAKHDSEQSGTTAPTPTPDAPTPDVAPPPPVVTTPASPVDAASPAVEPPRALHDPDSRSSVSIEAPFSIGRLTVANPDAHADSGSEGTPKQAAPALPSEHPPAKKQHTAPAAIETPAAQAPPAARVSPPPVDTGRPMSGNSAAASQRPASSAPPQSASVKEAKFPSAPSHRNSESSTRPSRASYDEQRTPAPVAAPRASSSSPDKRHAAARSQEQDLSKSSRRSHERERTTSATRLVISSPKPITSAAKHASSHSAPTHGKRSSHSAPPPWAIPASYTGVDNTPMSNASVIANPPTPQVMPIVPPSPSTIAPTLPPKDMPSPEPKPSGEPSPSLSATYTRRTETFRLVRSESGRVFASADTIQGAMGEQWEVMESHNRSPSKSKGKEKDSAETVRRHSKEQRGTRRRGSESQVTTRATSPVVQHESPRPEEPKATRRHSEDRRPSAEHVSAHKPTPPTPASPPARPLERAPTSKSVRPTSEMPAAEDLNAVRAREAWEMERLFKAKSMTTSDEYHARRISSEAPSTPPPRPISKDLDAMIAHGDTIVAHGSSHTSFVVQPLQGAAARRNSASAAARPPEVVLPPLAPNPLPEPPRESDYKPAPFPVMKLDTKRSPEHWTKLHDGLTTAH